MASYKLSASILWFLFRCFHDCGIHGKCASDYTCDCDLGWLGENCSIDCGCHGHSDCSQGIGICDSCQGKVWSLGDLNATSVIYQYFKRCLCDILSSSTLKCRRKNINIWSKKHHSTEIHENHFIRSKNMPLNLGVWNSKWYLQHVRIIKLNMSFYVLLYVQLHMICQVKSIISEEMSGGVCVWLIFSNGMVLRGSNLSQILHFGIVEAFGIRSLSYC